MADPALTVADLEAPKSIDPVTNASPSHSQSNKETETTLSHHSILKKSKA